MLVVDGTKKIQIVMVGPAREVHGGISEVVNTYFRAGLGEQVDITYIESMKEGSKIKKLFVAMLAFLRFFFCVNKADIVHIHAASDSSFVRKSFFVKLAHKRGKKIILHQHGGDFVNWYNSKDEKGQKKVRDILDMADIMLVLAPVWVDYFGTLTDKDKISAFHNSIFIPRYDEAEEGEIPIAKEPHSILFLGRLCETKGIRELAACLPDIIEAFPDVRLYLAGIWEDEELKELFVPYQSNVKEMGWVSGDGKSALLDVCEVFVLPTHFEGQSVSIVEAMASYCAVVASNIGGVPMMITDDYNGLLVPVKNSEVLGKTLIRMLGDSELRYRLTANARKLAQEEYDINQTVSKLLTIYSTLAGADR